MPQSFLLTRYEWKEWALIVLLGGVGVISYRVTGANDIIRIVTFVAACKGIPLRQMLKYVFYVTLAGCTAIVVLSVTGIYGDISLTQAYGRAPAETTIYIGAGDGGNPLYVGNGASQRAFLYVFYADGIGRLCVVCADEVVYLSVLDAA